MEPNNPDKNKLKIKLKFQTKNPTPPPVDDDELKEGELEPEEVVNTNKRVCPHCSKEFSNGKALGGHLRIHAIEKDYKSAKKQKFVVGSSSGNREFWCNICHRSYHSEKALYGHMRSHPDRKYRGMEPPNGFVTDDEDEDEDEDEDDNDGGVRELRWKVTGKRGQKIMDSTTMEVGSSSFEAAATELMLFMANSVGVSKDEDEDEDENEGEFMKKVKRLVREKLGKKKMEEKKSGIKKEKLEEIEGILKEKGLKIEEFDEDELYFLQDDLGISSVFADDYYNSDSSLASSNDEEIVVVSTKSDKKKEMKDKKKRKRVSGFEPGFERPNKKHHKKDDDDGDGGDNDNNGYSPQTQTPLDWPCCTCGKIFNSHQALGGHRSSHNKKNYSKSSLALTLAQDALTLAQDPIQGGQVQIDQGSGLTDVGPGSRSGSGDEVKSVIEVGESSSSSPPVPAQTIHTPAQTIHTPAQTSSPSAQTSSPPLGQSDRLPYMIDLNVSLMDEEEGGYSVIDSGF